MRQFGVAKNFGKKFLAAGILAVLVSWLPGGAAYAATTLFEKQSTADGTGSATSVVENGLTNHVIRYNNNDAGIIGDLTLDDSLTSQTIFGTPQAITGWDLTAQTSNSFQFKAELIPPEGKGLVFDTSVLAGTIAGNTGGGDGFVPLYADDGNIYWVFHHLQTTVQCANPATGAICTGYPVNFTFNVGGQDRRGWNSTSGDQAVVVGNRMFFATGLINGSTPTYDYGLGCFDLITRAECSDNPFQVFGQFPSTIYHTNFNVVNAAPQLVGNNMYVTDFSQKVWCYDVVNTPMTACPGYPKDISDPTSFPARTFTQQDTVVQEGSRLFRFEYYPNSTTNPAGAGVYAKCFDVSIAAECAGWGTSGKKLPGAVTAGQTGVFSGFVRYTTSLVPDAICSDAYADGYNGCLSWADGSQIPDTVNDVNGIPNLLHTRVKYCGSNSCGSVANPGHRPGGKFTFFGSYPANTEFCWDWTTNDACKVVTPNSANDLNPIDTAPGDGFFGDNGYLRHPANAGSRDYGARYDSKTSCWWAQGDANLLWSFDDDGNVPCIPLAVRDDTTLDLNTAYCASGIPGDAAWSFVKVSNFNPADWNRFVVEVKDPAGNVLASFDANTGPTQLDISSINALANPELSYFIYATITPGRTPYANVATTPLVSLEFTSDSPIEFCAQARAAEFVCTAASNTVANLAELRIGTDTNPAASDSTSLNITPDPAGRCADLSLAQTPTDPDTGDPITTFIPGTNVDWVLQPTNESPYEATNIEITTTFPPGVTPQQTSGDGWICSISGQTVTCTLPSAPPGPLPPLTISTAIDPDLDEEIEVTSTVDSDADDPTPADNTATTDLEPSPASDLTIAKSHDQSPVAGSTFAYEFQVTNNGPSDTPSFTVSDELNSSLVFVPAGSSPECSAIGQTVTCAGGALAAGETVTLTIVVAVSPNHPGGAIENTATVSGPQTDPQPGNNSSTDNVDPSAEADVAVEKTLEGQLIAGQNISYILAVTNHGPSAATNVTISDNLPTGLTLVALASSSNWNCDQTGSFLSCLLDGTLGSGESSEITLTMQVDADAVGEISNTVSVTSTATDPNMENNSDTAAATIGSEADLAVTKTLPAGTLAAGTNAVYQIAVTNNGPSDAQNVVVSDELPAGLTFVSSQQQSWNCSASGQTFTCNAPLVANGHNSTIEITVAVAATASGEINNAAEIAADTPDPNMDNNTSTVAASITATPPSGGGTDTPSGGGTGNTGGSSGGTGSSQTAAHGALSETGQPALVLVIAAAAAVMVGAILARRSYTKV